MNPEVQAHWEDSLKKLQTRCNGTLEKLRTCESPTEILILLNEARTSVHRTKGLAGLASEDLTRNWLEKFEDLLVERTQNPRPLDIRDDSIQLIESGLQKNLDKFSLQENALRKTDPNIRKKYDRITVHLKWSPDLYSRLDAGKVNLLLNAFDEGYRIVGVQFKIPVENLSEIQKFNFQNPELFLLDLWPKVTPPSVEVLCVFAAIDQLQVTHLEKQFPFDFKINTHSLDETT